VERSSRSRRSRTSDHAAEIVVRDATPDDARDIAHVRGRAWREAYAHIFTPDQLSTISVDEDAERWTRFLGDPPPRSGALVAVDGGSVIGFASHGVARDEAALGELYTIYVLPECWGMGAGQALMRETLSRLIGYGLVEAVLWVLEDNPRTRRFYERSGWHADGGVMDGEWLGTMVREVRYRIHLMVGEQRD
jgi:ribosomal protein S18 acetylase RimI-like enzyme